MISGPLTDNVSPIDIACSKALVRPVTCMPTFKTCVLLTKFALVQVLVDILVNNSKIRRSIVRFVLVNVMYLLIGSQFATNFFLRDCAVGIVPIGTIGAILAVPRFVIAGIEVLIVTH